MGKRKGDSHGGGKKKFKALGFIDPNTSGVYATCNRGKEQQCRKEIMNLLSEKIEQYYDLDDVEDDENDDEAKEELSIEDQIKQELNGLKAPNAKRQFLKPIELGCECLVFIKTRRPINPEELVEKVCKECMESKVKNTRVTQKLSPVTFSVSPTMDELKKLAVRVLKPHFHQSNQKPYKFAIQVNRRNFNTLEKGDIIKTVAECVGREHGHLVDLKKYDKLIMVECYKTNVGMSVVNNYEQYERFNLQQIFEKNLSDDNELSRVKNRDEQKSDELVGSDKAKEERHVEGSE